MHLILETDCSKKPLEPLLTQNNNTWYNLESDCFFLSAQETGISMGYLCRKLTLKLSCIKHCRFAILLLTKDWKKQNIILSVLCVHNFKNLKLKAYSEKKMSLGTARPSLRDTNYHKLPRCGSEVKEKPIMSNVPRLFLSNCIKSDNLGFQKC